MAGTYRDGKFNLIISFRYNADAAELALWRQSFQKASELLFAATDGQQQFGKLYVCNNSTGGSNAGIWIDSVDGTSSSNARIWEEFIHTDWKNDEKYKPFVILHESGHYLYALGDEYTGPSGDANCIGDPPGDDPNACIMERGWWEGDRFGNDGTGGDFVEGPTTDFCVPSNHDLGINGDDVANDTRQTARHGEACWQTIVDRYTDVSLPDDLPDADRPADFDDIDWIELSQDLRFVLVVDRSGSMGLDGSKPMQEAIIGASFWADNAVNGDFLGVVSFDNRIETEALTQINVDADRDTLVDFIEDLSPRGTTAMGDALRAGMGMITGAGAQSATQVIVLFSDGRHNTGEDPLAVVPDLIAHGIRVYTVGFGPMADVERLTAIAEQTGGRFYQIDADADLAAAEAEIRDTLITLSEEVREDGGIVTADASILDSEEDAEYSAMIDNEASIATFAVSWDHELPLTLTLTSPTGQKITAATVDPTIRYVSRSLPFRLFQITKPTPGQWKYKISLDQKYAGKLREKKQKISYHHYVFAENKKVYFALTSPKRRYKVGEPIHLLAQVHSGSVLTNLPIHGFVQTPKGNIEKISLVDNGDKKHGSDIAHSGRFSTLFKPTMEGQYTFTFIADNRKQAAVVAEAGDREKTRDKDKKVESQFVIPAFVRKQKVTIFVGRPHTRSAIVNPQRIKPGYEGKLHVTLQNIPWHPGTSKVSFSSDIVVTAISEQNPEGKLVLQIKVNAKAKAGFRDILVTTGGRKYLLEGFVAIEGKLLAPIASRLIKKRQL